MGSTGSGHFSDYSGVKREGPAGSGAGGASGVDRCQQAFSTILEEVAQCDYYMQTKTVPPPGSELSIVLGGRIFAIDSNGTKVGALPTSLNYLASCLAVGTMYVGVVKSSMMTPLPIVEVDFVPQ